MRFSSSLSQRTSCGQPSKKKAATAPARVSEPKKSEMHLQAAIPPWASTCLAMAYKIRLQTIQKKPSDDCQKRERLECSSVRYQTPVMWRKPGDILLSKKPWRARRAINCDQFWTALIHMRHIPGQYYYVGQVQSCIAFITHPSI